MDEYLGKLHVILHDFNELLSPASTPSQELKQGSKFFILLDLHGLPDDYSHVHDKILGSPVVLDFTSSCSTLLCVSGKHITNIPFVLDDSSALIFQGYDRTLPSKSGKGRHKCDHYGKLGHKIDRCYALEGRPLRFVVIAQNFPVQPSTMDPTSSDISGQLAIFNEFFKWYEDRQNSGSIASVTHSDTPFVGFTHSNSLGPWILDSGAIDHITGNKSFFFFFLLPVIYHPLP